MHITEEQIKAIEAFALNKYKKLDYSHNVNHAYRTTKLAKYLAQKEEADVLICRLGALLHQFHPEGASEVDDFLRSIGLEGKLLEQLINCVESVARSTMYKAKFIEAKVVFDADKLQLIGPFGIIREVAHRIEAKKIDFHKAVQETKELQIDIFNRLQTKTAKELAVKPHTVALEFFRIFEQWDKILFQGGP